jgi:hypothetical protein
MKNRKEFTIIFERGVDCGIAKISVYNITNNTYLTSVNTESTTYAYLLFDTYIPAGYSAEELAVAFNITLTDGCEYIITVEHSGTYNASASSPYKISVLRFLSTEKYTENVASGILRLWHSSFPSDFNDFVVDQTGQQPFECTSRFSGDGVTRKFYINGVNHASTFVRFSIDGGENWLLPSNLNLTWGSNTNCDDNLFDASGYGGVNFDLPPEVGSNNVLVVWRPMVNKFKLIATMTQPQSMEGDVVDFRTNPEQLDFAIELIP